MGSSDFALMQEIDRMKSASLFSMKMKENGPNCEEGLGTTECLLLCMRPHEQKPQKSALVRGPVLCQEWQVDFPLVIPIVSPHFRTEMSCSVAEKSC
jgi:hypothetical protein